ncbi:hypothetical protein Tco_1536640, partial [Tanacetum coccineum]
IYAIIEFISKAVNIIDARKHVMTVTDNQEKDKIEAKTDKNRARNGRDREKSTKVNPEKVKVKGGADIEEMLNGPTRTHLMGRVSPFIHYMKTL